MPGEVNGVRYFTADELLDGGEDISGKIDEFYRKLREDDERENYPFPPGHMERLRKMEDWSKLNSQVFGCEILPENYRV